MESRLAIKDPTPNPPTQPTRQEAQSLEDILFKILALALLEALAPWCLYKSRCQKVLGKVVDAKGRAKRKYGRCVFCDVHLVSRTARRDSIEIM
jgi:hypothetical protein